jgi:phosphatidylglycerol:prolipoprotein diacylglycerol transferase
MAVSLELHVAYSLMVLLGLSIFFIFRPASQYNTLEKRDYYRLQAYTLIAAILGAKLVVLMGDFGWPMMPFHDWADLLTSGRSIVGALLFGFLVAEGLKPWLKYSLPPNDRFAVILPFSVATGRLGCWMSGCCLGIPMSGPFAVTGIDGVPRFPAALVEMAFHLLAGTLLILLWRRALLAGRLFAFYLVTYGVFRFATEHLRETPKVFSGFSAYQWFSMMMVLAGATALYVRRDQQGVATSQITSRDTLT